MRNFRMEISKSLLQFFYNKIKYFEAVQYPYSTATENPPFF